MGLPNNCLNDFLHGLGAHSAGHGIHWHVPRNNTSFFIYDMLLDVIKNLQRPKIDLRDRPGAATMNEVVGNLPDGTFGPSISSEDFRESETKLNDIVLGVHTRARDAAHEARIAQEAATNVTADQHAVPQHVQAVEEAWPKVLDNLRLMDLLKASTRKMKSLEGATADLYRAFLRTSPQTLSKEKLRLVRIRLEKLKSILPAVEDSQASLQRRALDDFFQKYGQAGHRSLPPPPPRSDVKYRITGLQAFWPVLASSAGVPSEDPLGVQR
mmetsp:Transcript_68109/g.127192  ORF Transcript_68109/g.127192 Transcript_68109/m.127192 type:complete len:269 (+) Transcript_68109:106-912(+)